MKLSLSFCFIEMSLCLRIYAVSKLGIGIHMPQDAIYLKILDSTFSIYRGFRVKSLGL